jgi:hypothetical protein
MEHENVSSNDKPQVGNIPIIEYYKSKIIFQTLLYLEEQVVLNYYGFLVTGMLFPPV